MSTTKRTHKDSAVTPGGILETVVYCPDLNAARHFYHDLIGLELVSDEPDRHLFFRLGESMLLVFNPVNTRESTVCVGNQKIPRHGTDGASHFCFRAEGAQLDKIKRHLVTHGVAIESEITWPGGGRSVYCRDPAGNSIEFATRKLWFPDATS